MGWVSTEKRLGVPAFDSVSATALLPLGTRIRGSHPTYGAAEFLYVLGGASIVVSDVVTINIATSAVTRLAATTAVGPVGLMMATTSTAAPYGFALIKGTGPARINGAVVSGSAVYAAATGAVDDAVVAGELIANAMFASTANSGTALVALDNASIA